MDEYSGKRGIDGVVVPRKGMGVEFRDTANIRDQNSQICSRLGCSSKANPPKVAQVGSSEKGKSLRPSMRSSGKEVIGSSSRTTSSPGKPLTEPQKTLISQFETDSSETSSVQDEPEISELGPPPVRYPRGFQDEGCDTDFRDVIRMDTRSQRNFHQRPGWHQQEIKSTGPVTNAVSSRYGLRNLRCNSISDVIPAACSSSDSPFNRRKGVMKKRHSEEGSSSTVRGKKMTESSLEGSNCGSRNGISISDSRRSRIIPSHRDNSIASVRTQRSVSSYARGRFSSQGNENPAGETNKSPLTLPLSPHSGDVNAPGSPYHTSVETPFSRPSSYSRPGASSEQLCGVMPMSPAEYGITRSLINQDSFWRYDMDGIAEVLSTHERIEQDDELTYEQFRLLETNLFLTGLNFYDHHRDMRLDIDNMSYEELLALEERMGTVSTALTEEALSECLKRSIYQSAPPDYDADNFNEHNDDIKCCICQEEYAVGDEVGTLQCTHKFHVVCIQEWLRLKNWCPICKESATPSNSGCG